MIHDKVSHPHNTNMEIWYKYIDSHEICREGKSSTCAVCGFRRLMWEHANMSNSCTLKLMQIQSKCMQLYAEKKSNRFNQISCLIWHFKVCMSCSSWSPRSYGPWFPNCGQTGARAPGSSLYPQTRHKEDPLLCIFSMATRGFKPHPLVPSSADYLGRAELRSQNSPAWQQGGRK